MKKNKILIEAGPASANNKSGVGYYVQGLLRHVSSNNSVNNFFAYYFNFLNRNKKRVGYQGIKMLVVTIVPSKLIPALIKLGNLPFLEIFIPRRFNFILYTNYVALPSIWRTPYGLVIYDLGFIDHPEYVQEKNLHYLKKFTPRSINNASLVITISEFTKSKIEEYFPSTRGKVIVTHIPPVIDATISPTLDTELQKMGIEKKSYILYLGTVEPRKNITNLVKAYCLLDQDIKDKNTLVIAGGKGWNDEEILSVINKQKALGEKIILTGYISDSEKSELYSNASMFVLPSHYEGFGMPILEAMQYGIPIAVSDLGVFHEVAGDCAVYFNQKDPYDIAEKIGKLVNSNKIQAEKISKYKQQLAKFSWEQNTKIILDSISEILEVKND